MTWRDSYDVLGRLGAGTSGTVWLANQRGLNRRVAIKELAPELLAQPGARARLHDEARMMARLDHPNCVKVFGIAEEANTAAIVMEYVPGVSLKSLAEHGPLTVEQSLSVLEGALSGLGSAHALGLVHGDLKPENILVGPDGISKLVDFGLASTAGSTRAPDTGSPAYASPEAMAGAPVDARSDLYSAALVLCELLTGHASPGGAPAVLHGLATTKIPPPVQDLVIRALDLDSAKRPQDADEFLRQLRHAADAGCGPTWRKRARLASLVAALIAGGVGALGVDDVARAEPRQKKRWWRRAASSSAKVGVPATSAVIASETQPVPAVDRAHWWRRGGIGSGSSAPSLAAWIGAHQVFAGGTAVIVLTGSITASVLLSQGSTPKHSAGPTPAFNGISGQTPGTASTGSGSAGTAEASGGGSTAGASNAPLSSASTSGGPGSSSGGVPPGISGSGTGSTPSPINGIPTQSGGPFTWTIQDELPNTFLESASCPDISHCLAGGYVFNTSGSEPEIVGTSDGGSTWIPQSLPAGPNSILAISCADASYCWAVDTLATTDGGAVWVDQGDTAGMFQLAISCPATVECMSVGEQTSPTPGPAAPFVTRTVDGGNTWNPLGLPSNPGSSGYLSAIDCPSTMDCIAAGTATSSTGSNSALIFRTTDMGASWTLGSTPISLAGMAYETLDSVSCVTTQVCWIVGADAAPASAPTPLILATVDGGATWTEQTVGSTTPNDVAASATPTVYGFSSISCPTTTECWTVGSGPSGAVAYVTQDGGATWNAQPLPSILQNAYAIATSVTCPTASACWVIGHVNQGLVGSSTQGTVIAVMNGTDLAGFDATGSNLDRLKPPYSPLAPSSGLTGPLVLLVGLCSFSAGRLFLSRRRCQRTL